MSSAPARSPFVRSIPARTHGRYLVAPPAGGGAAPLLVGFHGYAENPEMWIAQVSRVPAVSEWLVVAVQALHRFYNVKTEATVGSWMTRQDRELLIQDNVQYVRGVLDDVQATHGGGRRIVYAGFSQGVAMAYRAAAFAGHASHGIVALGGDVPPEIAADLELVLPPVLLGSGTRDEWYGTDALEADARGLRARGVDVETVVFDGGHEWGQPFVEAMDGWLRRVAS